MEKRSAVLPVVLALSVLAFQGNGLRGADAAGAKKTVADEPAAEAPPAPENDDCLACHGSKGLAKKLPDGKEKSLFADAAALKKSVHESLDCVACHAGISEVPHPKGKPVPPPTCGPCHRGVIEKYRAGVHGKAREGGNAGAASCVDCHGSHDILPAADPASRTHHSNAVATCGRCHGGTKMTVEMIGAPPRAPFFAYQESVHGRKVADGSEKAATCIDCHRSHDILPPTDSRSTIFRFNVPDTCGRCHGEIRDHYKESVHGKASAKGISRAPVCTDCHGIHTIKSHLDPDSSVSARAIARTTCPQCHQSMAMTEEYGLPSGKVQSYLQSYHGLAGSRGSTSVANCASCHGIHDIYPSTDARSTIHATNLAATCGKCHPGAGENFVRGKMHSGAAAAMGGPPAADLGSRLDDLVKRFYLVLILTTIGAMLAHNLLDLRKKIDPAHRAVPPGHLAGERLDRNQRIQHALLASSFIVLALTGFALRFPGSWLSSLFGEGDGFRRLLHRGAAAVLMLTGAYHLGYLAVARSGRRTFRDLLPGLADLREAAGTVAFNLGLAAGRPHPRRFGYVEKTEYWALVWGTVVMAATGLALWFKTATTGTLGLPLWALDLARTIHYYEAWLAALAIVAWHFYFVVFDPAVYPMNWSWLRGTVRWPPRAGSGSAGSGAEQVVVTSPRAIRREDLPAAEPAPAPAPVRPAAVDPAGRPSR